MKSSTALLIACLFASPALADQYRCEFGYSETYEDNGLLLECAPDLDWGVEPESRPGCEPIEAYDLRPIRNMDVDTVTMTARWEEHRQRSPYREAEFIEMLMRSGGLSREAAEASAAESGGVERVFNFDGRVVSHSLSMAMSFADLFTDENMPDYVPVENHIIVIQEPEEPMTYVLMSNGMTGEAFLVQPVREGTGSWLEMRFGHCEVTPAPEPNIIDPEMAED